MDSNKNRRKKIVQDQSSHVWRHARRCVHCSAIALNLFGRRQQLITHCEQNNFTGTVCNSARGVGLVFDQKTYTFEPIHDEPMSRMWRGERGTCWLMKTTFVSQETMSWKPCWVWLGLVVNDAAVYAIYGTLFFSAPQNRAIFGWTMLFLAQLLSFGTSHDNKFGMDLKRVTSSFQRCINVKTRLCLLLTLCTNITWTELSLPGIHVAKV